MSRVVVLAGGQSNEREVSLRSGQAVAAALISAGHDVSVLDTSNLIQIEPQLTATEVVFPALHGLGGEDGVVQAYLEKRHIRFVGSNSQASALCFDKLRYSALLKRHHITMPTTELVDFNQYKNSIVTTKPYVLKPNKGGSSIDTVITRLPTQADQTVIKDVFKRNKRLLLQPLIAGIEITVGVLIDKALPVIEIIPPLDQEFDFVNKYNGATAEICPPKNVSQAVQARAAGLAKQIHDLCHCRDMTRTDMIVTDKNELFVLETNTIPGLTNQSLLPRAAEVAGLDMPTLCDRLVKQALSR